jgi:hypothetical protein
MSRSIHSSEKKVAPLDVNQLGRRSGQIEHRHEIGIGDYRGNVRRSESGP